MKIFKLINSKIRYKLILGFVLVSLFVTVVSYIGLRTIREIEKGYGRISTKTVPLIQHLDNMKFSGLRLISSATEFAFLKSVRKNSSQGVPIEQEMNLIKTSCKSCHETFAQYKRLVNESFPEKLEQIKDITEKAKLLMQVSKEFIEMNKRGIDGAELLEKKEKMEVAEIDFLKRLDIAIKRSNDRLEIEETKLVYTISSSFRNIFIFSGLSLLFSVLIGVLYSRSITKPLIKLTQQADSFRKGNLDTTIEIKSIDEIGILVRSYNEMAERIKLLITQLEDEINFTKQAEEEIKNKNEELSKTNAEKDKFFSIIAHDLKSPFHGFLNLTELMADSTEKFSQEEFVENSKSLNESARNLYKLLENLLEWAQMQNGSMSFSPQEIDLQKIVSKSIKTVKDRAVQKGITIINKVPKMQEIYADEKMIDSVFRNLLSNAIKFTRKDGKIIVSTEASANEKIEVTVSDTGVGMSEENVKKLFKLEEKVSSKGTEGEPSTGLGLLLCKEFVEKHGGKIWVESEVGKGSSFRFTLSISDKRELIF